MSELITISLGAYESVGDGWQVEGQAGSPTLTATVQGTGSVSATVVVHGSNDGVAWSALATLSASGTDTAVATGSWSGDYARLRMDVTQLSAGARVHGVVAVDQTSQGQVVGGEAAIRVIVQDELATMESFGFSAAPIPGLGRPINDFKTTGTDFDFALEAAGGPTIGIWGTVPADACAIEFWSNGAASDDVIYWATRSGALSAGGSLATNIGNNDGGANASARRLSSGEHIVLPLTVVGTVDALFRFAGAKAGARMQGRFISANARFPYLLRSNTDSVIAGAGVSTQFPFTDPARFPEGTIGVMLQIKGGGGVRARYDGGVPSASFGDLLPNGNYFIDYARHGVAISALRLFVPAGTWVVSNALKART